MILLKDYGMLKRYFPLALKVFINVVLITFSNVTFIYYHKLTVAISHLMKRERRGEIQLRGLNLPCSTHDRNTGK